MYQDVMYQDEYDNIVIRHAITALGIACDIITRELECAANVLTLRAGKLRRDATDVKNAYVTWANCMRELSGTHACGPCSNYGPEVGDGRARQQVHSRGSAFQDWGDPFR